MELLKFPFHGDVLAQLCEFERAINDYCVTTAETFSDRLRCGVVTTNLPPGPLRDHVVMHVERLATWANFRQELEQIARVQQLGLYGSGPMDLGGVADENVDAVEGGGKRRKREERRNGPFQGQVLQMWEIQTHGQQVP